MFKNENMELVDMTCNAPLKNDQALAKSTANDQLLTPTETATFLKVSRKTISNWTRDGKIRVWGLGGRRYYKKSEILNSLVQLKSDRHER